MRKIFIIIFTVMFTLILFSIYSFKLSFVNVTSSEKLLPITQVHLHKTNSSKVTASKELLVAKLRFHNKKSKPVMLSQLDDIFQKNCTKPYSPDFGNRNVYDLDITVDAFKAMKTKEFIEKTANPTIKKTLSASLEPIEVSCLYTQEKTLWEGD